MTYIVKDECIKCKLTDCVEVCPVDCFYEGENMLVINPDECIDCGVCEPECPIDAIKADTDENVTTAFSKTEPFSITQVFPSPILDFQLSIIGFLFFRDSRDNKSSRIIS